MSSVRHRIRKNAPEKLRKLYRLCTNSNYRKEFLVQEFGIRYTPDLPPFPPMVMIDTTTRCNLACNHCPSSVLSKDKNWIGDMNFDLYKKIIDEIAAESPKTIVRPFDGGEPFLRKDLEDLIKYAKTAGLQYVSINTNGTLLTEKRALKILASGLDHIEFSVDAFSEATFKKIKNADLYAQVINNIERMIFLRNKHRPEFKISVSFVKQKDNVHEANTFQQHWNPRVDHVNIREYHQHGSLIDDHGKYRKFTGKYRPPCPYLWDRIIIQHDGNVRFCENDWKAEYAIGNIKSTSLKEMWHSNKYQQLRDSHVAGTFTHTFCKHCKDWDVIRKKL